MISVHDLKLEGKSVATASKTNFSFTFNNVLDFWSVAATATGSPGQCRCENRADLKRHQKLESIKNKILLKI